MALPVADLHGRCNGRPDRTHGRNRVPDPRLPAHDKRERPHETAHQWFYSLVGNDQARDPWIDEGLATWAEARVNGAPPFPSATIPPEVTNKIGEPMSFWDRLGAPRYFLGAYLQTYRALLSLGPRSQVDCAYACTSATTPTAPLGRATSSTRCKPSSRRRAETHIVRRQLLSMRPTSVPLAPNLDFSPPDRRSQATSSSRSRAGGMFWLRRKRFVESYRRLISARRSQVAPG